MTAATPRVAIPSPIEVLIFSCLTLRQGVLAVGCKNVLVAQRPVSPARRTLFVVSQDISRPAHGDANFGILGMGGSDSNAVVSTFRMRGDDVLLSKITVHE